MNIKYSKTRTGRFETNKQPAVSFDDLEDAAWNTGAALTEVGNTRQDDAAKLSLGAGKSKATVARFPCTSCRGTGKFYGYTGRLLGDCFRCKGSGLQKTDGEAAARRRRRAKAKDLQALQDRVAKWREENPIAARWIDSKGATFGFAADMAIALCKYGSLTERQLAAVMRCVEQDAKRAADYAARKPDADIAGGGFTRMVEAFNAARSAGLRSPKLRVLDLVFSLAPAGGKNAGCIYVRRADVYLGKINAAGAFFASRDASAGDKAQIKNAGSDPLAAAVLHGKQTGSCACCGRTLENEDSVAAGIGPICAGKWGLA